MPNDACPGTTGPSLRAMRRLGGVLAAASLAVTLAGCSDMSPPDQDPDQNPANSQPAAAPSSAAPSSAAPSSAAPSSAPPNSAGSGQTDPMKLDAALLKPEQLPGWQAGEPVGAWSESTVDPPACQMLHKATLEKVASDMGATVAYQQDDKSVQEYLDLVDRGTDSLKQIEQQLAGCQQYKVSGEGADEPITVERIDLPQLGDKSLAVRMISNLDGKVENQVAWVAQGDVLLMVRLEGDQLDQQTLPEVTTKAHQQLQASL